MLVKRVEPDGTLHMTQLGVMYPGNFGLGPVALLGDHQTLTAVLTLGSEHTTQESPRIWETKPDQGDTRAGLATRLRLHRAHAGRSRRRRGARRHSGVRATAASGTSSSSATISAATFMDDRAAVVALLQANAAVVRASPPPSDGRCLFRLHHQRGNRRGGRYLRESAPCRARLTIAVEVGPTEAEYGTTCSGGPDRGLQRRAVRVRQGGRRRFDGGSPPLAGCRRSRRRWVPSCPTPRTPRPAG